MFFDERVQLIYNCDNYLYSPSYLKFIEPPFKFQILSLTLPYSNLITEWYVCGVIHFPQSGMISDISLCACLHSHLIYQLSSKRDTTLQHHEQNQNVPDLSCGGQTNTSTHDLPQLRTVHVDFYIFPTEAQANKKKGLRDSLQVRKWFSSACIFVF